MTDGSGAPVAHRLFRPYGEERYHEGTLPTDFGFTAQREDEATGLLFMHARYYDARLGRFVSADTVVPQPGEPQNLNRYTYAANSPMMYVDPSGHFVILPILAVAAVGGLVGLGVDYFVTTQVAHEEYSVEQGCVAFGVGAVGGAVGAVVIPALAGAAGAGAVAGATALGATEATAATAGTVTTIVADVGLAGGANVALGSAQRNLTRVVKGEQITSQDINNDLHQNWERDFAFGAASSVFGQAANHLIDVNLPTISRSSPPVIQNIRFPELNTPSPTILPMNYNRWTPYIRGGLQTGATVFSDASVLDAVDTYIRYRPAPHVQPSVSPLIPTPGPYYPH